MCGKFLLVNIEKYIEPLNMNGLRGRMLRVPSQNNKYKDNELLLAYGQHTSIERMMPYAEVLSEYGRVTMPDLPGFGGMEPFYKLKQKATFENYADYLASFIKLRYKRKKVIIMAMSTAMPAVVIMLQKYPELVKKTDFVVSMAGFVHKDDFKMPYKYRGVLKVLFWLGSTKIISAISKNVFYRGPIIKVVYRIFANKHDKFKDADKEELNKRLNMEVKLWKANDMRTHFYSIYQFFSLDLCSYKQIKCPVLQLNSAKDMFLNAEITNQHMQIVFEEFAEARISSKAHVPAVTATADDIHQVFPRSVSEYLSHKRKF